MHIGGSAPTPGEQICSLHGRVIFMPGTLTPSSGEEIAFGSVLENLPDWLLCALHVDKTMLEGADGDKALKGQV